MKKMKLTLLGMVLVLLIAAPISLAAAATLEEMFQWVAKRLNVSVDPFLPLPTIKKVSLEALQGLYLGRAKEGHLGKKIFGLYMNTPTPAIYALEGADDSVVVHEIVHYFQYRYNLTVATDYRSDCQLVDGLVPGGCEPPEDFWESHAQLIEHEYTQSVFKSS